MWVRIFGNERVRGCGRWGAAVAGVLALVMLGCGTKPTGPVKKLNLDPKDIQEVVVSRPAAVRVSDKKLVAKCVRDVNRLSFVPHRPHAGTRVPFDITFKDSEGKQVLQMGVYRGGHPYIKMKPHGGDSFFIEYEAMPTLGRLSKFSWHKSIVESLRNYSEMESWTQSERGLAEIDASYVSEGSPVPTLPKPRDPEHLRKILEDVPPLSLKDLDQYDNEFREGI